jgi:hypothetical protein
MTEDEAARYLPLPRGEGETERAMACGALAPKGLVLLRLNTRIVRRLV